MRLRDHYDWIVLGNHPAALLSAGLVARLGLSVMILPLSNESPGVISSDGQIFDSESNYLMGLGRSSKVDGLVFECLSKLGILSSEEELIDVERSAPQVLTPECRMVLGTQEVLQSELYREFGKGASRQLGLLGALKTAEPDFLNYWHNLPKRLTLSSNRKPTSVEPLSLRDVRKKLQKSFKLSDPTLMPWISTRKKVSSLAEEVGHEEWLDVCAGLWGGVHLRPESDPALFDLLHMFSLSRVGGSFRGGMTGYREFLINLARRLGAHVPIKTEAKKLFVERGRFAGVHVTGRGNMIQASAGILGCTLARAYPKVTYTGRNLWVRKKKPLTPTGWKFSLALTVRREVIPSTLLPRSIWQEKGAPMLELEVVQPSDFNLNDPDHRILYLRTWMPFTSESLRLDYQRLIAGRMLQQAMELLPFLEFHVTRIYPEFRGGPGTPFGVLHENERQDSVQTQLSEVYGFTSMDAIPDHLLLFSGKGLGSQTGIEGLFLAAGESYPEWGTLGPTVAALEAVASLAHRSGLAGPFV